MAHHNLVGIIVGIALVVLLTTVMCAYRIELYFGCGFYIVLGTLTFVYFLLPVIFHCSPPLQRQMIFMNLCQWSVGRKYFEPSRHNISGARNFHLSPLPGVKIGLWHMLPNPDFPVHF